MGLKDRGQYFLVVKGYWSDYVSFLERMWPFSIISLPFTESFTVMSCVYFQHFRALAEDNKLDNTLKGQGGGAGESDTLVLWMLFWRILTYFMGWIPSVYRTDSLGVTCKIKAVNFIVRKRGGVLASEFVFTMTNLISGRRYKSVMKLAPFLFHAMICIYV